MVILQRVLTATIDGTSVKVPVNLYLPMQDGSGDFRCDYEIGWPAKVRKFHAYGADGVQSVLLAMQMIGVELYSSDLHKTNRLSWLAPGDGYGFPLPKGSRDFYAGSDRAL